MSNIWMPLYVADYLADTGHLSTTEHGAYFLLILHYWQKETLPDNDKILAQICRVRGEQWRKIRPQLEGFFTVKLGQSWGHSRIEGELRKAAELREKKRLAGIASGNIRSTRVQQVYEQKGEHPSNQSQPQSKIVSLDNFVVGKKAGEKEMSPENKLALFQNWLEKALGRGGPVILRNAADPSSPHYAEAVARCQRVAAQYGKGWPHQWPKKEVTTNG